MTRWGAYMSRDQEHIVAVRELAAGDDAEVEDMNPVAREEHEDRLAAAQAKLDGDGERLFSEVLKSPEFTQLVRWAEEQVAESG